jgi:hypothetical protein
VFDKLLRALLAEPVLLIALAVPLMSLAVVGLALLLSFEPVRRGFATKGLALRNALLITMALIKKPTLPRFSLRRSRKQIAHTHVTLPPPRKIELVRPPKPSAEAIKFRQHSLLVNHLALPHDVVTVHIVLVKVVEEHVRIMVV